MTYCVGLILDAGMVFASDSRTNAGVDQVSSFRKMKVFEREGDRLIVIMSSGNLAITQSAVNHLENQGRRTDGGPTIWNAQSLFEIATLLGDCLRQVRQRDVTHLTQSNVDAGASFVLGGQVNGERQRLFLIYSEGNFIEATMETPFFQIGETKYGRPIIDRVIKPTTNLVEAAKCLLVSFDSTMRSNISVGPPIDLLCYERDRLKVGFQRRLGEQDSYFADVREQWGAGLKRLFTDLPDPRWEN